MTELQTLFVLRSVNNMVLGMIIFIAAYTLELIIIIMSLVLFAINIKWNIDFLNKLE